MKVFYEREFFDEVIMDFENSQWSEEVQALVLYKAVQKFCKLLKLCDHNDFFINGFLYLNGLLAILNEYSGRKSCHNDTSLWNLMYKFCNFLDEKWKSGEITRVSFLYEEFSFNHTISRSTFDQVVALLEDLELIEILSIEKKAIKIIRPTF